MLRSAHGGNKPRSQKMSLHMMDAEKRDLPCDGQALACIESGEEIRAHPGPAGGRDEIWLAPLGAI